MGRRKIEIQPIRHERNRSVTFLKRKNGLFKKAYELGVLCSVDIAVIVFEERQGHHTKVYEYGSRNVSEIVQRHLKFDGDKDARGPSDFSGGNPTIAANDDEDDEDDDAPAPTNPRKRQRTTGPPIAPTPVNTSDTRTPSNDTAPSRAPSGNNFASDNVPSSLPHSGPSSNVDFLPPQTYRQQGPPLTLSGSCTPPHQCPTCRPPSHPCPSPPTGTSLLPASANPTRAATKMHAPAHLTTTATPPPATAWTPQTQAPALAPPPSIPAPATLCGQAAAHRQVRAALTSARVTLGRTVPFRAMRACQGASALGAVQLRRARTRTRGTVLACFGGRYGGPPGMPNVGGGGAGGHDRNMEWPMHGGGPPGGGGGGGGGGGPGGPGGNVGSGPPTSASMNWLAFLGSGMNAKQDGHPRP
ncbi:hypothetical protein BD626DRAFT_500757 [Schizophyllum amplum]|uniref:MADS-box domain-containing protein n=1 Tax=Schizophyllum amplum TaxID=97359 RepID=A0A550CAM6_9AGAR|nr:hypothetical protein BD626DRAFT_500757 [Auriculariopsis ampla]